MSIRRIMTWIKLAVLLVALGLLYQAWRTHRVVPPPPGSGDNDEDDVKYTPVVSVSVAPVELATLRQMVSGYGYVEGAEATKDSPAAVAAVTVPASAIVASVDCIEGQQVEKGQSLLTLDGRSVEARVASARQKLAAAQANNDRVAAAVAGHEASRNLLLRAQHEVELAQAELDASQNQQPLLRITSPIAGTVTGIAIHPGEVANPATPAVTVVDLSRLVAAVAVPPDKLAQVRVGQETIVEERTASVMAAPATRPSTQPSTSAKVVAVDPTIDLRTGMGSVDIALAPDTHFRPGQFISARIIVAEHRDVLTVSKISIVNDAKDRPGISLAVRDFTRAFRHPVKIGFSEKDRVEVESEGLKAGDFVVTRGAAELPDQSRIEVAK